MKKRNKTIVILVLLLLLMPFSGYILGDTRQYKVEKLLGGEDEYLVVLTGREWEEYGNEVVVSSLKDGKKEILRWDIKDLKPWKLLTGDIDGDGIIEISIGVYKQSPLHPVMAKRPFIYSFDGEKIVPKWRGSRLSRPFEDYVLFDIDGDNTSEIIASEYLEDGSQVVHSYKWKGFGFDSYLESDVFNKIEDIWTDKNVLYIKADFDGKTRTVEVFDAITKLEWRE